MKPSQRPLAVMIVTLLLYAATVVLCIDLTRHSAGIATVWLANGVLAVGLMLLPRGWNYATAAGCALINVLGNLSGGDSVAVGLTFSTINISESVLSAWLGRKVLGARLRVTNMRRLALLVGLSGVGVSLLAATAAAGAFSMIFGRPFEPVFISWLFADALGTSLMMAAILVMLNGDREHGEGRPLEALLLYLLIPVCGLVNYLTIREPVMFMAFPVIMLIAFRLGPRGAALGTLILFTVAMPIALDPTMPILISEPADLAHRIRLMQLFIGGVFACGLATALVVEEQSRLRRLLTRRQLMARASRVKANQANRAKGDFLAAMSHEIRTPLNSVLGFTSVLLSRKDIPQDARRQLQLIDRAGQTLLSMVGDVLDFSKIEAGEMEIESAPVDVVALAQETLEVLSLTAEAKGLELVFETDAHNAWRMADSGHLRQILLNLLSNAVKFTHHGKVMLSVCATGGPDIILTVKDTGIGMSEENMGRLFRRFSQADGSISRNFGGTGLGLAISKELVELMGGQISVASTLGQGSRFDLRLPLALARAPADPASASASQLAGVRILLVDDHPANREIANALLTAVGCVVQTADSGKAAIEALRQSGFEMVLMDVHMPEMDGLTVARLIKAMPHSPPVIAMSADVLPEQIARCKAAGMVDHIGKPINRAVLYSTVAYWSGRATPPARGKDGEGVV